MGVMYISFVATIIILQCMCHLGFASTGFAESPSSVTIEVENGVERDAVFRCRHQRRNALIGWLMNGSSSILYPDVVDGFIQDSNGTHVYTLTVPAIPEYNGTEVVSVATFLDGSPIEVTPPAGLIIIVASEAVTQPSPTTIIEPGFVTLPSSLNKTVEQEVAVFRCQHNSCDGITWRVNGISTASPNVTTQVIRLGDRRFRSSLSIATLPDFNNTTIECGAVFFDGSPLQFTPPVTLLIQDIPGNISNLGFKRNYSSGILATSWDPLPMIDITGIDPDIIYHMEIFKITCGQSILMNDENVTKSIANNTLELMEIYTASITPRNNVPRYVDGPMGETREKFMHFEGRTLFELSRGLPRNISNKNVEPVPRYYTMVLESLDGIGGDMRVNISVEINKETITMQTGEPLLPRRLWNAVILPYNCEADMQKTELSTHAIQNIRLNSTRPGQIEITGEYYVDESTASGIFLIVYSLTNESDIQYIYKAEQPEQNYIDEDVTDLVGTEYGVSVFALENGVPFPRVVTSPRNINVEYSNDQERKSPQRTPIEFKLDPILTGVCIHCTFLDSSTTDCGVVIHPRISQLNSSGLMNIESSHKFTRSGDTAYGCIEGVNLEQHQVGVINGKRILPTMHPDDTGGSSLAGAIVGAVLAVIAFTLPVVIGMIVYYTKRRKRSTQGLHYSEIGADRIQSDAAKNINRKTVRPVTGEHPLNTPPQPHRVVEDGLSIPSLPLRVIEDVPPLPSRGTEDDVSAPHAVGNLASHDSHGDLIQSQVNGKPPPDNITPDNGSSDPTYSQPVLPKTPNTVAPPAATEKLIYDDIQGYQNQQGQIYALPRVNCCPKMIVDDLHQVVYSKIQLQSKLQDDSEAVCPEPSLEQACDTGMPPLQGRVTVESLLSHLLPYASKWQSLAGALSLDEDRLDEIYTNNETEEACLQVMIELYMMRTDLDHSWEEIESAVKKTSSEVAIGVQESGSLSSSPMFNGSTIYPSDMHAKTGDLKSAHLPDVHSVIQYCKTSHHVADTAVHLGNKWHSMEAIPTEMDNKIHELLDHDFKSEPNIPYAQGCPTSEDNVLCSLAASNSLSNDDIPPATSAANNEGELRKGKTPGPGFPTSFYFPADYSVAMFVAMDGHSEAKELLRYIPCQESLEEETDYNSTLIHQLGIGREKLSSMKDCQESSQDENLDVHVDIQFTTLISKKEQKPQPQKFSCQSQEVIRMLLNFCERTLYCLLKCLAMKSFTSVFFSAIQYNIIINYVGSIT